MKIITLLEAGADGLYRKIDGLEAMLNDPSTTPGEKENAAKLIANIKARLASEFPGQQKPQPKAAPQQGHQTDSGWYSDDWMAGMAKAAKKEQELKDLKKNNPKEYENVMRQKLNDMQDRLKYMRRRHIPGDVESARDIQDYASDVDRFIRHHFPKDWQEIEKKREEQRNKGYAYADKKAKEKTAKKKDDITKSGLIGFKQASKLYSSVLEPFFKATNHKDYRWGGDGMVILRGKFGGYKHPALGILAKAPTGDIRRAWNEMTPEIQKQLIEIMPKIHTLGRHNVKDEGWASESQRDKMLNAMKPYKIDPAISKAKLAAIRNKYK